MSDLVPDLLSHAATLGGGGLAAWAMLRAKTNDATSALAVATTTSGPEFAGQTAAALKQASDYQAAYLESKAETLRLRGDLAESEAAREALSRRLDLALVRLDEQQLQITDLAQQLTLAASAISRLAQAGLLPALPAAVPTQRQP